ncbi:helix-turn-helix domain-containing protein [Sphaerisporangium aureirubrum]|uniref:Helix-turn-helix domain-containing protein n=1 Tax=Sphaerisporangium aureirubrum TaxID=1544736 RepID=A0ABW1NBJ7_9ACTN
MQTGQSERFAARLRVLKNRADVSFEELAKRTGASSSSLHRYCSGAKIPVTYGVVHAFGKACGASGDELRDLHRLWAVADASRVPSDGARVSSGEAAREAVSEEADGAPSRKGRRRGLVRPLLVVTATLAVAGVATGALWWSGREPRVAGGVVPTATAATVRVYNVEGDCGTRAGRVPACSMGLARDPRLSYDAGNVVARRVWHDDRLRADCILYDGERVADETGVGTTRWFRVQVGEGPGVVAWLPAVRTRDHPALPACE